MDDVLERMLAVEREASLIVEAAEARAQSLFAEARERVAGIEIEKKKEMRQEADDMIASRVERAQRQSDMLKPQAFSAIKERAAVLRVQFESPGEQILRRLAYPEVVDNARK